MKWCDAFHFIVMPMRRVRRSPSVSHYGMGMGAGYRRWVEKGIPQSTRHARSAVRLEKAGVDVVPKLVTINVNNTIGTVVSSTQFTVAVAGYSGTCALNPLNALYTNPIFTAYKGMYTEYRMK